MKKKELRKIYKNKRLKLSPYEIDNLSLELVEKNKSIEALLDSQNNEVKDIEKLKTIVFSIIDNFKEELLEYIYNRYYLETNQILREAFETKKEIELEKLFAEIEDRFK